MGYVARTNIDTFIYRKKQFVSRCPRSVTLKNIKEEKNRN
jgi:hypothetical protein